jgi:hypothetical protein
MAYVSGTVKDSVKALTDLGSSCFVLKEQEKHAFKKKSGKLFNVNIFLYIHFKINKKVKLNFDHCEHFLQFSA